MTYVNTRFISKKVTGLERYAVELSLALKNIDPSIFFLSPKNKSINDNIKRLEPIEFGYFNNYLWEQIELPLFLNKKHNPLLINLANTAPILYGNQILVAHDIAFLHNPEWYSKKAAAFFKFIVGRSIQASKKIITVSNNVLNAFMIALHNYYNFLTHYKPSGQYFFQILVNLFQNS